MSKTFEEEVVYITRKLQALINAGYVIKDGSGKPITSAHQAATTLVKFNSNVYTLTLPDDHQCCCLKWSDMAMKMIKPYIKNKFIIEQRSSNSHYLLVDISVKEELQQLQANDDIELVDTFELEFTRSNLPTYTNRASLYTVKTAPVLTQKETKKILTLSERILANKDNYFLLSNSISHTYNAPMTVIRLLGENVISLKALNLAELILVYATNSSAVYRNKTDELKPFIIPYEFFSHDDFELEQSIDEISSSLAELKAIGLINSYSFDTETITFEIVSNIITKSIKQYTYTQPIGYYKSFGLRQQEYCYTFINYLQYVLNIKYTTKSEVAENVETKTTTTVKQLTICLSSLLYNLELDAHIHDHTFIARVLNNLLQAGIKAFLLKSIPQQIDRTVVRDLLTRRARLHEIFVLDTEETMKDKFEEYKELTTLVNLDISPKQGRSYFKQR